MIGIQSKWRYLFMFLGIQLVVMALLSREGYQKRVSYFIRIFRKPDVTGLSGRNHTALGIAGGDVYANLSHLSRRHGHGDVMPYCPKTSPLIGEWCRLLLKADRLPSCLFKSLCFNIHKLTLQFSKTNMLSFIFFPFGLNY